MMRVSEAKANVRLKHPIVCDGAQDVCMALSVIDELSIDAG